MSKDMKKQTCKEHDKLLRKSVALTIEKLLGKSVYLLILTLAALIAW